MVPISSTYRLQLRPDTLTLRDVCGLVDYFATLGVSHLYLSPVLTAAHGSTHGYDVTDPTTVSAALGGPGALAELASELRSRTMGLVIDIVPNHLGVADPRQNPWWWDVLKFGAGSQYAQFFDIDWSPDNGVGGRLAIPAMSSENDPAALTVDRTGPEPMLALHEQRFPLAPGTFGDGDNPLAVHDRQHYRLVRWQSGVATYRRFFTVNSLAAVRQENPHVFGATHKQLAHWVQHDLVDGVRVDHPDGLADPAQYLRQLRSIVGSGRWIVIEKILGEREPLDATLPIDGTTGYDALAQLGGVFVDPAGEAALTELARTRTGSGGDDVAVRRAEDRLKRAVLQEHLVPEVRRLVAAVQRDAHADGAATAELTTAIVELLAAMPVYRSDYAPLEGLVGRLVADLQRRRPDLREPLAIVVRALAWRGEAAARFQQCCGAAQAKAVEDCLFYRLSRLVSLQEVGGTPARFGLSVNEFHLANVERAHRWPASMTTLSTHDTKRGEDVRARIGVLSQVAQVWADRIAEWERSTLSPDPALGNFLLQNMFGVWPADRAPTAALRQRLHAYAEKAMREAGTHTSWSSPDVAFEAAVHTWVDAVADGPVGEAMTFLVADLAVHAWSDALGQKLLQLAGPGIPDLYQGSELWEDTLVDPDNRRPVDFGIRRAALSALGEPPPLDGTGRAKLWTVAHTLWLRRQRPHCFVGGSYLPVYASGSAADHLIGFGRGAADGPVEVLALAARHSVALAETGWGDTVLALPDGTWVDRLTGRNCAGKMQVAEIFARLPVALLTSA